MTVELNKAILLRFVDLVNEGELDALDQLVDVERYEGHVPFPLPAPGFAGEKQLYAAMRAAMPDLTFTPGAIYGEGDLVGSRGEIRGTHTGEAMFGVPASGRTIGWTGIDVARIVDGRIVERWLEADGAGLLQQLGALPAAPAAPDTPRERNKRIMRRMIDEIWNRGDYAVADELFAPDHRSPSAPDLPVGPDSVKMLARMFREAMPDYHMDIDLLLADEERVVARFTQSGTHTGAPLLGLEPRGHKATWTEIGILRIRDDRIVESWYEVDMLSMLGQLNPQAASA